jgi:hypothetical protein
MKPTRSPHLIAVGHVEARLKTGMVKIPISLFPATFQTLRARAQRAGTSFAEQARILIDRGLMAEDDHK